MFTKELEFGCNIALEAGRLARRHDSGGVGYEDKSDDSPVTIADRECERLIVRAIEEAFPDDGILGEEGANKPSRNGRRWIIDPIDGTRDFVRGNGAWSNLIALESDGEVIAGFCNMPVRGDLFWAAKGEGAFRNGQPIRVSGIDSPTRAVLCVNGFNTIQRHAFAGELLDWMAGFWAVRSMGGCLDAMMVSCGQAEIWIESAGKPWDFAPLKVIVEEAGGRFFNFDGGSSIHGGDCVLCAPGLEEEARRFVMADKRQ